MKFTWFNLMPWPYLPDDFREKDPVGLRSYRPEAVRSGQEP